MKPYIEFFEGATFDAGVKITPHWLGGKGFGLVEMTRDGLPVPPGFIIPTGVFKAYRKNPEAVLDVLRKEIPHMLNRLSTRLGYTPLLSVRSGAPVSMPGMMDTVLNVGLTANAMPYWVARLGEQAAWDCRRRLVTMFATVVRGLEKARVHKWEADAIALAKVDSVTKLTPMQMHKLCGRIEAGAGAATPPTVSDQVVDAIEAVFCSWFSDRAVEYRRLHDISEDMGTAVVVQAMVFGNMNEKSATGVLFTRDPSTGEKGVTGEFLLNAQGEDVVSGAVTPRAFYDQGGVMYENDLPLAVHNALGEVIELAKQIEKARRDMQDIEFTIEDGKLWLLQTRAGKRSAAAAFKIAHDMRAEGLINAKEMRKRVTAKQFAICRRPQLNREKTAAKCQLLGTALAGSKGCAVGRVAFNQTQFDHYEKEGHKVILVRRETTPDDIGLMARAAGILTATGGFTSHAAVVARGMDKVCLTGWSALPQDMVEGATCYALFAGATDGGDTLSAGDVITLDGETGEIWRGEGVVETGDAKLAHSIVSQAAREAGMVIAEAGGDYWSLVEAVETGVDLTLWRTKLMGLVQVGQPLLIDLRGAVEVLPAADVEFLHGLGGASETTQTTYAMAQLTTAQMLAKIPGAKARVILPAGFAADHISAKLKVVPLCNSLDEAMAAGCEIMMSAKMREVLGEGPAASLVQQLLVSQGVKYLPEPMSIDEAAQRLLG